MTTGTVIPDKAEKLMRLFRYIKELCALKYTLITDISRQPWRCFLRDMPVHPCLRLHCRDRADDDADDSGTLLEITKPDFTECPPPPSFLLPWLMHGWDRFENQARVSERADASPDGERFSDSAERTSAFKAWLARRGPWQERENKTAKARDLFAELFRLHTDLEREPETLELMAGEGVITVASSSSVCHPVLLKRVRMEFDSKANIIRICDSDSPPELYGMLLNGLAEADHQAVDSLRTELEDNDCHPFDRNDTPVFLRSLTNRLCAKSSFLASADESPSPDSVMTVRMDAVYFVRRRIDGSVRAVERILDEIASTGEFPAHLGDLVAPERRAPAPEPEPETIEEQLASLNGESGAILLAKAANREQLEIAKRLERHSAVLVQGPPGTGKTHTIANLLGHLLSQGKSVLVASHTRKALSVLKSQVHPMIRDLCVSLLEDNNRDMVSSVEGIGEYTSKHDSAQLEELSRVYGLERNAAIKELANLRRRIRDFKGEEHEPIVCGDESVSPQAAAKFLAANHELGSLIPGEVEFLRPLPLSSQELAALYASNAAVSAQDEAEIARSLPDLRTLPDPGAFSRAVAAKADSLAELTSICASLGIEPLMDQATGVLSDALKGAVADNPPREALEQLSEYARHFRKLEPWMMRAAADGRRGGQYRANWVAMREAAVQARTHEEESAGLMLGVARDDVSYSAGSLASIRDALPKLKAIMQAKGRIPKSAVLFDRRLGAAYNAASFRGGRVSSLKECEILECRIIGDEKRSVARVLWDALMAAGGAPSFDELGEDPDVSSAEIACGMLEDLDTYLDWYTDDYAKIVSMMWEAGLNPDTVFADFGAGAGSARTEKILTAVRDILPRIISLAGCWRTLLDIAAMTADARNLLTMDARAGSPVCAGAVRALDEEDAKGYEQAYSRIADLNEKRDLLGRRVELLTVLEQAAPQWAGAIRAREGVHGSSKRPEGIADAWKCRQYEEALDRLAARPLARLQREQALLAVELRGKTANLAGAKAWLHLLDRIESDPESRQALRGWSLAVRKIGKGTGKNAPMLRKEARKLMALCQRAVPAWIMTTGQALDNLDPSQNRFDVVIIDEASQSDISALALLYMASEVIIVGDDRQVSPLAVGMDTDKMKDLQSSHIKDAFMNWAVYTATTSLYDIAGTTYQPLMLREHFRCLPEIIGYSNRLSYDGQIRPLRDAGGCSVYPPVVSWRVDGGRREGRKKTNPREAQDVIALMIACMEQEEYAGKTFGVISLLGFDQARLIQDMIYGFVDGSVIGAGEIEDRRIICGDASHFQGDERDVVFLSMVDSNEGDGPLRKRGEGANESTRQRYNVAASRARDQLWVVHSLDYASDLKEDDIRRDLLEYAANPAAFAPTNPDDAPGVVSPFEEDVARRLADEGFAVRRHWPVGTYTIGIVVGGSSGQAAVECDGEFFGTAEAKIQGDMERQSILERQGWRFVRLRGSEYWRDPARAVKRAVEEIEEYGVRRGSAPDVHAAGEVRDLDSRVRERTRALLAQWRGQEPPSGAGGLEDTRALPEDPEEAFKAAGFSLEDAQPGGTGAEPAPDPHLAFSWPTYGEEDLTTRLKAEKIVFVDRRRQGGVVWVIYEQDRKAEIESFLDSLGFPFTLEKRGALATDGRAAYRVMTLRQALKEE